MTTRQRPRARYVRLGETWARAAAVVVIPTPGGRLEGWASPDRVVRAPWPTTTRRRLLVLGAAVLVFFVWAWLDAFALPIVERSWPRGQCVDVAPEPWTCDALPARYTVAWVAEGR